MAKTNDDIFEILETAIIDWNRKMGGMHQNLSATLAESRARLGVLARVLGERRTLSTTLVVARAKLDAITQRPEQRAEAVDKAVARVAKLKEHLDAYQAALDALHSEAARSVAAAEALAKQLLNLHDERNAELIEAEGAEDAEETLEALRSGQESKARIEALEGELHTARKELEAANLERDTARANLAEQRQSAAARDKVSPTPWAREAELTQEVEKLQAELGGLREQLAVVGGQTESAAEEQPAVPLEAQEKIVDLRAKVEQLSAESEERDEQIMGALAQYEAIRTIAYDEGGKKRPLGQILVDAAIITSGQLDEALREQSSSWNRHLGAILVELGFTTEQAIAQTLAAQLKLPFVDLSSMEISQAASRLVSRAMAQHHTCIPFEVEGANLKVALANPLDLVALEDLQLAASRHIAPHVAAAEDIRQAIRNHYGA